MKRLLVLLVCQFLAANIVRAEVYYKASSGFWLEY